MNPTGGENPMNSDKLGSENGADNTQLKRFKDLDLRDKLFQGDNFTFQLMYNPNNLPLLQNDVVNFARGLMPAVDGVIAAIPADSEQAEKLNATIPQLVIVEPQPGHPIATGVSVYDRTQTALEAFRQDPQGALTRYCEQHGIKAEDGKTFTFEDITLDYIQILQSIGSQNWKGIPNVPANAPEDVKLFTALLRHSAALEAQKRLADKAPAQAEQEAPKMTPAEQLDVLRKELEEKIAAGKAESQAQIEKINQEFNAEQDAREKALKESEAEIRAEFAKNEEERRKISTQPIPETLGSVYNEESANKFLEEGQLPEGMNLDILYAVLLNKNPGLAEQVINKRLEQLKESDPYLQNLLNEESTAQEKLLNTIKTGEQKKLEMAAESARKYQEIKEQHAKKIARIEIEHQGNNSLNQIRGLFFNASIDLNVEPGPFLPELYHSEEEWLEREGEHAQTVEKGDPVVGKQIAEQIQLVEAYIANNPDDASRAQLRLNLLSKGIHPGPLSPVYFSLVADYQNYLKDYYKEDLPKVLAYKRAQDAKANAAKAK